MQVGTYPIRPRVHGGQRRAGAIWDAYRRRGIRAEYAAIYYRSFHPEAAGPGLFPAGPPTIAAAAKRPYSSDLVLGEEIDQDAECMVPLLRFWNHFRPTIIQLEQPYLWPAVQRLMAAGHIERTPVIYSGQNVEFELKGIINDHTLLSHERQRAAETVRRIEEDLARHAVLVVAVCDRDAQVYRQLGARRCVVIRNGHDPHPPQLRVVKRWQRRLRSRWKRKNAFFVSSSHLPNYLGFEEMVGPHLGYLPPDAEIFVVGQVSQHPSMRKNFGPTSVVNNGRARLLRDGLNDDDMAALLHLTDVVLLPITCGGGSNLKTVQALLSGRPILATARAFRSFEEFTSLPRVCIADSREAFHRELQRIMLDRTPREPLALVPPEPELEALTWGYLGDRFVEQVLRLNSFSDAS